MKILIWVIVALVIIGGLAWFLSSDSTQSDDSSIQQNNADMLTENGRVLDTDSNVFAEIDEAVSALE